MPRKFIKRYLPNHQHVRDHKHLRFFGTLLHDPNLWHLNRRSVSGAFATGLFMAFVPVPFQMVFAAAIAIGVRVNLPISVGLVWITNPLTIPPLFYFAYKVGVWVLGTKAQHFQFELSFHWLMGEMGEIWRPLIVGSLLVAVTSGALGYLSVRLLWRWHVIRQLEERRRRRAARKQAAG
jgi:uncharacterized protein (DUF2062 family)